MLGEVFGLIAVVAGPAAAARRYRAVLAGRPAVAVERETAIGFFAGTLFGLVLLLATSLIGAYT